MFIGIILMVQPCARMMCLALPRGHTGYGSTSGRGGETLACFYQGLPLRQRDFRASRRLSRLVFPEANREGGKGGRGLRMRGTRSGTGARWGSPSFEPLNVDFDPPMDAGVAPLFHI